jgi:hypothetical protein
MAINTTNGKAEADEKSQEVSVNVRLSGGQHKWVVAECERLHESQSTVIRGLIREKMEAEKQLIEA